MRILITGVLLAFFPALTSAQFNIRIGYVGAVMGPEQLNNIAQRYNRENPWLADELRDLNLINGFTFGLRNRWESFGLEFSWTSKIARRVTGGVDPAQNKEIYKTYLYRLGSFSAGAEIFRDNLTLGGSIDISDFVVRRQYEDDPKPVRFLEESFVAGTLYLGYEIKTSQVLALSFRPYVQIPFQRVNIFPYEEEFFPNTTANPDDQQENLVNFGLMLLFYNGKQ